ncbi:hypothetical protein DdX_19298 [Ditylenchus destructor]|uniref:Uncharacterized protein n=1 Tax=Ditylenchus destructor TaxID=166010 RepID=A0AAD4MIQ9_9BILA|nr:hypothetical protein DdX_19298 [Ditylenchus destructor]
MDVLAAFLTAFTTGIVDAAYDTLWPFRIARHTGTALTKEPSESRTVKLDRSLEEDSPENSKMSMSRMLAEKLKKISLKWKKTDVEKS